MATAAEIQTELRRRRFRHITACVVAAIAIGALAFGAWNLRSATSLETGDVMLLYVGADDCPPCRSWQKEERGKLFASSYFPRISYREVKAPHLEDVLNDEYWPEDLRSYRDSLKRGDGVPLWLIVSDHKIIERHFGITGWRNGVLPRLKMVAR